MGFIFKRTMTNTFLMDRFEETKEETQIAFKLPGNKIRELQMNVYKGKYRSESKKLYTIKTI